MKNKSFEEIKNDKNLKVEKREISQNKIIKIEMVIEELTKRIKELEVTLKEKENIINSLKKEKDLLMSITIKSFNINKTL